MADQPAQVSSSVDALVAERAGGSVKAVLVWGGLIAALGSMVCCIVPFALFSAGVTTVWIGKLGMLASYQPIVIAVAVAFLGVGYYRVYRKPKAEECEPGTFCATPASDRLNKAGLWTASVIVGAAAVFNPIMSYVG